MSMKIKNILQKIFINKDYGLLFTGRLVSQIGDGIHYFALAWLILDLTGSGTVLGTMLMAAAIPKILLAPFTGVLADTLDRKKIIISMDVIRGIIIFTLGLLNHYNYLNLTILYITTVITALCGVIFGPAISATIPGLVKKEQLVAANARNSLSMSATGILGPIAGAIILGLFGYTGIFFLNGTSFLISAFSEALIRFPKKQAKTTINAPLKQFHYDFKAGFKYLWDKQALRVLIMFAVSLNFLITPLFGVVFPYFGKEVLLLDANIYGYIQSSFPAGLLIGSLLVGITTKFIDKEKLLAMGIIGQGFLILMLSTIALPYIYNNMSSLIILFAFGLPLLVKGIMNIHVNVPFQVMLQETVPDEYRGRVFGLLDSLVQIMVPVSTALYGVLLDVMPVFFFLVVCGSITISIGIAVYLSKYTKLLYNKEYFGQELTDTA